MMLATPMMTMSQGKPMACTMAPPVDGPVGNKPKSQCLQSLDYMEDPMRGALGSPTQRGSHSQISPGC